MVNLTSYISPSNLFLFGLSLSILSPLLYIIFSWERTKPNSLTVAFCFRHSPRCGGNEWNEHPQSPKEQYPRPDGLRQHLESLNDFFQATCECCQKRDPIPNTCGCANGNRMHGCRIGLWLYWPRDHSHGNGQDFACCGVRIPVGKCEIRLLFSSDQVVFGLHSQTHHEDPTPTFPSFFTFHHFSSWCDGAMRHFDAEGLDADPTELEDAVDAKRIILLQRRWRPGRWSWELSRSDTTHINPPKYMLVHDCPVELNQSEFDQSKTATSQGSVCAVPIAAENLE